MCNHRTANFGIGLPDALNLVFQFKELKSFCFELKYTEINWFNYKSIKGRYLYPVERICILCPSLCITCRHLYKAKKKENHKGKPFAGAGVSMLVYWRVQHFQLQMTELSRHQGTVFHQAVTCSPAQGATNLGQVTWIQKDTAHTQLTIHNQKDFKKEKKIVDLRRSYTMICFLWLKS